MRSKRHLILYMAVAVVAAASVACGAQGRVSKGVEPKVEQSAKVVDSLPNVAFRVQRASQMLDEAAQREYYAEHFWDEYDFADSTFVAQVDNTLMMQTLLTAVALSTTPETTPDYLTKLMQRTVVSKPVMQYFLTMGEELFYDPNSPYRNDEYYIPMLRVALESGLLDEYERLPYESDLRIVSQNRVGHVANDFELTLASGQRISLYDIEADYVLLFISNPGCPMCRDVKEAILASQLLSDMVEDESLKIVVLYPDADLDAWHAAKGDYPAAWINGYDAEQTIEAEELYDLKAIPSLYLLDAEKRVMLKDCVSVELIERVLLY
ncbi:MAG: DUF5106 domain-containing protein [Rikenellaceae bacterium]|nr:DUF5106 domain-containing protein [Rikenellaceae bacterium]